MAAKTCYGWTRYAPLPAEENDVLKCKIIIQYCLGARNVIVMNERQILSAHEERDPPHHYP
jgi:hypothetical protein